MNEALRESETESARSAEAFWRPHAVSPPGRRSNDFEKLEERVFVLERMMNTHSLQLATPMDVTKLQFTTRTVVSVVGICVGLAAGQWGLNYRLEGNVMAAIASNAKLQDERSAALKESISSLQREQAMQKYELQGVKEMLLKKGLTR